MEPSELDGTVTLTAPRAFGAPDNCSITNYDVLHIPSMPCNGISTSRLTRSGAQILRGNARTVVTDGRVGAGDLLLECTRVVKGYQRLCLVDDEEDLSDMLLASTIELPSPVAVKVLDTEMDRLG